MNLSHSADSVVFYQVKLEPLKSKIIILDFSQSKLKDIKLFFHETLPSIYKAADVRSGFVLFAFPQILLSSLIPFATLQTLFYQFFKTGTSLNIIEFTHTLHDATPDLGLQCSPRLTNCKKKMPDPRP